MPRAKESPAVKHLTEDELAARWGVQASTVARLRKNGKGPAPLVLTESRTKSTIRYRVADVEAWEAEHVSAQVPA
jgi:hypothetical protein